ncbi:MAG: ABC transporter permease [Terriglobales bacterium]
MPSDFRIALRLLAKSPAFVLIAVLTLALGVGASTAIFGVVDAVLLRPLPFPRPEQLVSLRERDRQFPMMSVSYLDYLDWVKGNRSFSALAAYRGNGAILTHAGAPAVIEGIEATASYFTALGVRPERGRAFSGAEDRVGGTPVAVLSDSLWHDRFGADPAILGKTIELDAKARTIIGVMPPGFPGISSEEDAPQYWIPLGAAATPGSGLTSRGSHPGINGLGRLKPGVRLALARADMDRIARALSQRYPKSNTGEGVAVQSYLSWITRNSGGATLWMLLAAVGLVLLIACANVANLLLARAAGRQKANAIRAALGASRARLIREHLSESLCLGASGAAVGLGIAWVLMRAAPALLPNEMSRAHQVGLDWRVVGFAVALALITSVLFGLAPAWQASRTRLVRVLNQGGRETANAGGGRLRAALIVAEMALALLLLAGAGLLIRSLAKLQQVSPGFNPHHVLTFGISLPAASYPKPEQQLAFMRAARARLAALPGVEALGGVFPMPFSGNDWENGFTIVGRPAPPPGEEPSTNFAMIQGDYFAAIGMHLMAGRTFNDGDTTSSPEVALVDTDFAKTYWPGPYTNALGKQIHSNGKDHTVVGVFARVLDYGLDASTEMDRLPELFVPLSQAGDTSDTDFIVRTRGGDPLALTIAATRALQSLDANMPVYHPRSMDQVIAASLLQRRLTLWLMGAFALLALLLAAVGIYGVLGYTVAQRTHELGVRMALGASGGRVLALVLGEGLRLALIGAAVGIAAALALGQALASALYGVSSRDPLTLVAAPVVLLAVAALACYLPARRATRVDPVVALRGE